MPRYYTTQWYVSAPFVELTFVPWLTVVMPMKKRERLYYYYFTVVVGKVDTRYAIGRLKILLYR